MIRIIILTMVLAMASCPASAFRMFGPNGYIEDSPEDIARRKAETEAREAIARHIAASEQAWAEEQARIQEHNARMNAMYRAAKPDPTCNTCPPRNKYNDGPAPGGHRRHVWRERTGFNTPAERIRAENEIRRLKRELKKEKARPNPGGAHPAEIRKQFAPRF